jgi:D-glutamate cyclase
MANVYAEPFASLANVDRLFERIGWQVDHLMSIDTRGKGIIPAMYKAAIDVVNAPLAMTAAKRIRQVVGRGDVVGLITGFPSRSFLGRGITETDGPVGAVYLARVLEEVLGAVPVIIIDNALKKYCISPSYTAGLLVGEMDKALLAKRGTVNASVVAFLDCPVDDGEAQQVARDFLTTIAPKALVAIEMPSIASDGFAHMAAGRALVHEHLPKADHFFHLAKEMKILRVGLGDGGNEMGMGSIREALKQITPVGELIAATTDADVPVVGASSNWAAYAIGVCIEALAGSTQVNRSIDLPGIIRRCAEEGAIDGYSVRPEANVDGTPIPMNTAIIDLMTWVVDRALAEAGKGWLKSG